MVFATLFIDNWQTLLQLQADGHLTDADIVEYIDGLTHFYADLTEPTFKNPILSGIWLTHKPFAEKAIKNYNKKVEGGKHSGGLKREKSKDAQASLSMLKDAQGSLAINNKQEVITNKQEVITTNDIDDKLLKVNSDKFVDDNIKLNKLVGDSYRVDSLTRKDIYIERDGNGKTETPTAAPAVSTPVPHADSPIAAGRWANVALTLPEYKAAINKYGSKRIVEVLINQYSDFLHNPETSKYKYSSIEKALDGMVKRNGMPSPDDSHSNYML